MSFLPNIHLIQNTSCRWRILKDSFSFCPAYGQHKMLADTSRLSGPKNSLSQELLSFSALFG